MKGRLLNYSATPSLHAMFPSILFRNRHTIFQSISICHLIQIFPTQTSYTRKVFGQEGYAMPDNINAF